MLRGLSLAVRPGEILGLAGPSGSGKSVLLRSITGRVAAEGGRLQWRGADVDPSHRSLGQVTEVVFEESVGATDLTVNEWMAYQAAARGIATVAVGPALGAVGLRARGNEVVGELSSGFLERLLLARTLLRAPALVLVDHPLAHLDAAGEFALQAWSRGLRDARAAVLWASADRGRLQAHCDRIAIISDGRVTKVLAPSGEEIDAALGEALR